MGTATSTQIQALQDSGTLALGNIQFQGGYDTGTGEQTGETFFDGLNGLGSGLHTNSKSYITLNYLNFHRYYTGLYFFNSTYITVTTLSNVCNNSDAGILFGTTSAYNNITTLSNICNNISYGIYYNATSYNLITLLSNANNNLAYGVYYNTSYASKITTLSNVNNNTGSGIFYLASYGCIVNLLPHANNNTTYGVYYNTSINNIMRSVSTTGNTTGGVYYDATSAPNYLNNALIAEGTEITFAPAQGKDLRVYSTNHDQDTTLNYIYTDGGLISSEATDRVGGTGIMWKLAVTNAYRTSFYPLKLSIAKIAVVASKLVTVKAYMKITSTTDILGALVCPGGQLTGMTVADIKQDAGTADTDWHELTITFTPTQAGVVEIEAWAWWVANVANESVYVEDMTITQAD
jgi:hypothetical protein